jgi:uncharacterized protein (DUF1778 family)
MARPKTSTKASPKPGPRRRKAVRKEEMVPIRMTTEQKETLASAAQAAGMGLSTWLLSLGLKAVKDG